jgi:hypothetical protein
MPGALTNEFRAEAKFDSSPAWLRDSVVPEAIDEDFWEASMTSARIPSQLRRAFQEFLKRRGNERPVSVANMIRRTRYAFPDIDLSDDELEAAIAEEVISVNGNIDFDRRIDDH